VIGENTVVTAGSVVDGVLPPGMVAAGNPARAVRSLDGNEVSADNRTNTATSSATTVASAAPSRGISARRPPQVSSGRSHCGLLISDFTIDPLQRRLALHGWDAVVAPYGGVVPALLNPPPSETDFAVVWTLPDRSLGAFARLLDLEDVSEQELIDDVDRYVDLVLSGLSGFRIVLLPTWSLRSYQRGRGLVDARPGGVTWALTVINHRLMERIADVDNVFVLDAQRWIAAADDALQDARRWYLGKIPFGDAVFDLAASEVLGAPSTIGGANRKLIVLDLDNTLWGGTVGDDGWEALRLGGHDSAGEAFVDFQLALRNLKNRGVLLALASKNDEKAALEAIDRHDAMVLSRDDFVAWRIDWSDKAANIATMVSELNLGLQSVVFIDDSPYERARVREALAEVYVPEWPQDPIDYVGALQSLTCFDTLVVSDEDRARTRLYAEERHRSSLQTDVTSLDDWLRQLDVVVTAQPLSPALLPRATQLLNKTNQMNLATRRLIDSEVRSWTEVCCQAMRLEERPRIAVDALRLLRDLVDLQAASPGEKDSECGLMAAKGGCHEPIISGSRADAGTACASTET
jgi:FkbH-like protein